jgi:hypothetical protein
MPHIDPTLRSVRRPAHTRESKGRKWELKSSSYQRQARQRYLRYQYRIDTGSVLVSIARIDTVSIQY